MNVEANLFKCRIVIIGNASVGKTALLLQYVQEVREDPARGRAELIDAEEAAATIELFQEIDELAEDELAVGEPA